ncbi:hypothetical protein [Novipirellula artificiosorum]|nr:hypothetical protein [Novipirellula artificiosorum]
MFDLFDEANDAIASKSTRPTADCDEPESWSFQHLIASRNAGVIHVQFKKREGLDTEIPSTLRQDFSQLSDSLVNNSRILLDFECLSEFSAPCIKELKLFNEKLQSKGSRMALCHLEPAVQASFFPDRIVTPKH